MEADFLKMSNHKQGISLKGHSNYAFQIILDNSSSLVSPVSKRSDISPSLSFDESRANQPGDLCALPK